MRARGCPPFPQSTWAPIEIEEASPGVMVAGYGLAQDGRAFLDGMLDCPIGDWGHYPEYPVMGVLSSDDASASRFDFNRRGRREPRTDIRQARGRSRDPYPGLVQRLACGSSRAVRALEQNRVGLCPDPLQEDLPAPSASDGSPAPPRCGSRQTRNLALRERPDVLRRAYIRLEPGQLTIPISRPSWTGLRATQP